MSSQLGASIRAITCLRETLGGGGGGTVADKQQDDGADRSWSPGVPRSSAALDSAFQSPDEPGVGGAEGFQTARRGSSDEEEVSRGLQLQSLWIIHAAAVSAGRGARPPHELSSNTMALITTECDDAML